MKIYQVVGVSDGRGFWYVLRFAQPLNMEKLAEVFRQDPDILNAEVDGLFGDGSYISAERILFGWQFIFSVGWGDCMAGCIHRHYWEVRVVGYVAELVREWGDPLP